jgi:hypothetical protein
MTSGPRKTPCASCPYRRDCPSGVWSEDEYAKLCLTQPERVLTADLRWVPSGDVREGDELVGFEADKGTLAKNRRIMPAAVLHSSPARAECVRVILSDGTEVVCTDDHPWLAQNSANRRRFVQARHLLVPAQRGGLPLLRRRVVRFLDTWDTDTSWEGGWLAGMYDGEGHLRDRGETGDGASIAMSQNPGPLMDYAEGLLRARGFKPSRKDQAPKCSVLSITKTAEVIRVLGMIRPVRLLPKLSLDRPCLVLDLPDVVAVESAGVRDIQSLSTSTGTYIGEGFAMHNTLYDGGTGEQAAKGAFGVFVCHQGDGKLCAGWAAVHGNRDCLALRLAASLDPDVDVSAVLGYATDVPLWGSGAEAAAHGRRDIEEPSPAACETVAKVAAVRAARGQPVDFTGPKARRRPR